MYRSSISCVAYCQVIGGSLPLAGVLLSLSGSGNYRQNNVTPETGTMQFTSLVCCICPHLSPTVMPITHLWQAI